MGAAVGMGCGKIQRPTKGERVSILNSAKAVPPSFFGYNFLGGAKKVFVKVQAFAMVAVAMRRIP
jgi:hypothetical protein